MPFIPLLVKALNNHSLQTLPELKPTDITLHTYTGENIVTLGSVDVDVSYDDKKFTLPLYTCCSR